MSESPIPPGVPLPGRVPAVIVGAGQAGLATSYWLTRRGVEHVVLERRPHLGGAWQDRWDSFHMNTPRLGNRMPGMAYAGPEPEGFASRDEAVRYLRDYAASFAAPVVRGTEVTRLAVLEDGFRLDTSAGVVRAGAVVLATGAFPAPKVPPVAGQLPGWIDQLHSDAYRSPSQLAEGGVIVVGGGQTGTQLAEELLAAGRTVHLTVSGKTPEAPRRYRGHDFFYWTLQLGARAHEFGIPIPTLATLPSPAARFMSPPLLSGQDGGHDIRLRSLSARGVMLHGALEAAHEGVLRFSDDLPARVATAENAFAQRFQPAIDALIAAAGIDAPPDDRSPADLPLPTGGATIDLEANGIRTVIWATGYRLDFAWLGLPILDQWGYPRHTAGVTEQPGLYAVGLPWLTGLPSALMAGVGRDAQGVSEHLSRYVPGPKPTTAAGP